MFSKPKLPTVQAPERRRRLETGPSEAQLQRRISMLEGQISMLEGQTKALEEQVRTIRQSVSWRVTAPLRWVNRHFQRTVRVAPANGQGQRRDYVGWIASYDTLSRDAQAD